jgi:hypothetical protein
MKGIAVQIDPKLTTSLDLFPEFEPINTTKIKWYDTKTYALEGQVGTGGWADGADTITLKISTYPAFLFEQKSSFLQKITLQKKYGTQT